MTACTSSSSIRRPLESWPRTTRRSTESASLNWVRRRYVRTSSRNAGDAVIRRSAPQQQQQQLNATAAETGRRRRPSRSGWGGKGAAIASRLAVINHRTLRCESADDNGDRAARQRVNYNAHSMVELILRRGRRSLTCAASLNNGRQPTINSVPAGALSVNRLAPREEHLTQRFSLRATALD
jgi:hypothetical protein